MNPKITYINGVFLADFKGHGYASHRVLFDVNSKINLRAKQ